MDLQKYVVIIWCLPYVFGRLVAPDVNSEIARMFLETLLVPTVISQVPEDILYVHIIGTNETSVDSIIERPHKESKGKLYSAEYPNDEENVQYFFLQADVLDFKAFIVKLIINKYWKVAVYVKWYCPLQRLRTWTKQLFSDWYITSYCLLTTDGGYYSYEYTERSRYENVPVTLYSKYNALHCKFLGPRRESSFTVFLFGEQGRYADYGYYRQFNDNKRRSQFNINKFLDNVKANVTHGASVRNLCDRTKVAEMCNWLLPFVIVLCIAGFLGTLHTLQQEYYEYQAEKKAGKI